MEISTAGIYWSKRPNYRSGLQTARVNLAIENVENVQSVVPDTCECEQHE